MIDWRKLLLRVMALVMALAPAAASAAYRTGHAPHSFGLEKPTAVHAHAHDDCRKAAASKPSSKRCKSCRHDVFKPDICALKCFKVIAHLEAPTLAIADITGELAPRSMTALENWNSEPPAPPPRG